jgi:radical SAM-linked protein
MQANYVQRLRLEFAKVGPTRFIGHLDLAKALERSLNRAQIPLAYTQGYNPRPRLQLAAALPLGFTSECELADIWLLELIDPEMAKEAMAPKMAPGIELRHVSEVELSESALQNRVSEAIYRVTVVEPVEPQMVANSIADFMRATRVVKERRGKEYDLRPLVHALAMVESRTKSEGDDDLNSQNLVLEMRLSMLPSKTGRPDEVLESLGIERETARIHRQRLILSDD